VTKSGNKLQAILMKITYYVFKERMHPYHPEKYNINALKVK
jgi:hypothetical protein